MNRTKKIWLPVLLAVVAGCDAGPTGPVAELQADLGFLPEAEAALPEVVSEHPTDDRRDPADLAARWIDYARGLLREAVEVAGPNPEPRVAAALREADHLLDQARRAFEAREFENAIRHAKASASISMRVIRFLEDGGRDRPGVDRPTRDQERPDRDGERPERDGERPDPTVTRPASA